MFFLTLFPSVPASIPKRRAASCMEEPLPPECRYGAKPSVKHCSMATVRFLTSLGTSEGWAIVRSPRAFALTRRLHLRLTPAEPLQRRAALHERADRRRRAARACGPWGGRRGRIELLRRDDIGAGGLDAGADVGLHGLDLWEGAACAKQREGTNDDQTIVLHVLPPCGT